VLGWHPFQGVAGEHMEAYDAKSCDALEKPFYRPIEAALRWCNLSQHEEIILRAGDLQLLIPAHAFPQWPCLRNNMEKIVDAIQNGELPKGREGRTVSPTESIAKAKITVRHTDLKEWMTKNWPDQKPRFLFGEIERNTHSSINVDTFMALQADRDALKARIEKATDIYRELKADRDTIQKELTSFRMKAEKEAEQEKPVGTKERITLLTIIAALCKEAKIDYIKHSKAAGLIQSTADAMGVSIGETTIEGYLKKIPDVLGARTR
jgi:hypothetical protein